jgi:predicted nucleotidyltransferase
MIKIVEKNIPLIIEMCKRNKLKSLYLFGSATDDKSFYNKSDIDFLYEFDFENYPDWDKGGFDVVTNFFTLKNSLEEMLDRRVDLIPDKLKNSYFINSVEKTRKFIYAKP